MLYDMCKRVECSPPAPCQTCPARHASVGRDRGFPLPISPTPVALRHDTQKLGHSWLVSPGLARCVPYQRSRLRTGRRAYTEAYAHGGFSDKQKFLARRDVGGPVFNHTCRPAKERTYMSDILKACSHQRYRVSERMKLVCFQLDVLILARACASRAASAATACRPP